MAIRIRQFVKLLDYIHSEYLLRSRFVYTSHFNLIGDISMI